MLALPEAMGLPSVTELWRFSVFFLFDTRPEEEKVSVAV